MSGNPANRVADYRDLIELDEPTTTAGGPPWRDELPRLLALLGVVTTGSDADDLAALHAVLAPLPPDALDASTVARIEHLLQGALDPAAVVDPRSLTTVGGEGTDRLGHGESIALWVGDITNLATDVVVNAANSSLLGCRLPYHFCIDYALHAAAGPRLRHDCSVVIGTQGTEEPVGSATITRGYALPARFVVHTVGPQLSPGTDPTSKQEAQLRSCYRSCLDVATEVPTVSTIAFCAISTGVYAYPKPQAAVVALETVDEWLASNPGRLDRVVFNLFSEADADHYRRVIGLPSVFRS